MKKQKKYKLTREFIKLNDGRKLFRIKALVDIEQYSVKKGDFGGFIEKEENLSQYGNSWVGDNAQVYDNAQIYGNARVCCNAQIYGDACVCGDAMVCDNAQIYDNALVYGDAMVCGNAMVVGDSVVCCNALIYDISDYLCIRGLGTQHRNTIAFKCMDEKIRVKCGCFYGTIEEFREQVKNTRDGKVAKEYLALADLLDIYFDIKKEV